MNWKSLPTSAVERTPAEVWQLVRDELVDLELEKAEDDICFVLRIRNRGYWAGVDNWSDVLDMWKRENCRGLTLSADCSPSKIWVGERTQDAHAVLSSFDLALPPDNLFFILEQPDDRVRAQGATLLTLCKPSLLDFQSSEIEANGGRPYQADESVLADIDFRTPADARKRFCRCIRTFHLEPLEIEHTPPPAISCREPAQPSSAAPDPSTSEATFKTLEL
ncbi:hypothetical protein JCM11641_003059 [Rhodosporidiobolus odoratus]